MCNHLQSPSLGLLLILGAKDLFIKFDREYFSMNQEGYDHLAYWLSNASTLLFLLQRSLKAAGAVPSRISLFGRITLTEEIRTSLVVRKVEAKYPALLFKQQIEAYVEKMYGIIRDNMREGMTSLISLCIQVPAILIQKMFTQIFSLINVQLFNSLLLQHECCSFSNGEYLKSGLAELELWCVQVKPEYAGSSWDELKHIRQAVGFLILSVQQPYKICTQFYDGECDTTSVPSSILSVQQLYRICTEFSNGKYSTSVSSRVLDSMRILMFSELQQQ